MSGVVHGLLASLKGAAASATDAFFRYVSLLLNTTSTNGAQNNTFLDSSTNNFSITRNGNTTQGTFSPFSQTGWSNFFDGTGDYLTAPNNAAFDFGSGDFTIESWIHVTSNTPTNQFIYSKRANNAAYSPILLYITKVGALYRLIYAGSFNGSTWGLNTSFISGTIDIQLNSWAHVALVRSGSTFTSFVNGVVDQTFTGLASALMTNTDAATVAAEAANGGNAFNGYISNVRIVKGTAVYTANFTPPTSPLTAITNTSLLTCQSNRFIDNSSNAFAITRNGDVSVQAFSPFNPTAAWSASTNGGSGYFDGAGDFLSLPLNTALNPGTGDFTFETWFYATAAVGNSSIFEGTNNGLSVTFNSGKVAVAHSGVAYLITDPSNFPLNQWVHVAASRSGTTLSLFVNGTRVGTATNSTNFVSSTENRIGRDATTNYITGYLSNLRLVKGTVVYDPTQTTLTVPTAPLTAITNTSLLLNFTNAGIFDSASGNDLETVGNAQVSTVQSKWGTTSISCDGTGDYVVAPSTVRYGYGTGDFTIEFWLYLNTAAADQTLVSNLTSVSSTNPHIYLNGATGTIRYYTASADRITGSALSAGQWYHIAVSRASSNTRMFINGTQTGSTYADANNYGATAPIGVGTYWSAGSPVGTSTLNGYIDDLRITRGYARYTANFTPPTAAFPLN